MSGPVRSQPSEACMPGRRLVAALVILAFTATACQRPSRSPDQGSSLPSATTAPPSTAPAGPSYSEGQSDPVADPVYPDFGHPDVDVLHYALDLRWEPS